MSVYPRLFSYKDRPVHLGPYPLERLTRRADAPRLDRLPPMRALGFDDPNPESLSHAMWRYMTMFDVLRDGTVNPVLSEVPDDVQERARHLKAAGYFFDTNMTAVAAITPEMWLAEPIRNADTAVLATELGGVSPEGSAAGLEMILADVVDSARRAPAPIEHHTHAVVLLVEYPRDPREGEPGCDWIVGTQAQRAALISGQAAVLLATYLRLLGHEARSHTATCSDIDLGKLGVACGLTHEDGENPYVGRRFGLSAVTTTFAMEPDQALAPKDQQDRWRSHGPKWWLGKGTSKSAFAREAFARREYRQGAFPFETIKRVDEPTTFIDHARVPRFPKRADFFTRSVFGDLGKEVQHDAKDGYYVVKSAIGACARRSLGSLLLLQFGDARGPVSPSTKNPARNADNLKAAGYYLGVDAMGLCAVPEWAWYSHDSEGEPITPYHRNGLSLLIDQGHETMEGASGDDWVSVGQSIRTYLRFSLLGGVLAEQIRRLGYSARVHSAVGGEVLQPPLLLLAGLGEVSRIGEVILNPFLGPRLKSGVVTTDLPMAYDKPIDFGLQRFCESCKKCARECPSGAITAGPKLMYNGYEIWKSDVEKCTRYRLTNKAGGMCGRCMKTCPWNFEGLIAEDALRRIASSFPWAAGWLADLDDKMDRGTINPIKKWWWDIDLDRKTGAYVAAKQTNRRTLQKSLDLRYEDQNLAVYPADVMPLYNTIAPLDREQGIERYRAMLTPEQYKQRLAAGKTEGLAPPFKVPDGDPPVFPVVVKRRQDMADDLVAFDLASPDGKSLPRFEAGAHIDVVIAPEYVRQYSLAGDPADASRYVVGLLREAEGRGGSKMMHRVFEEGRRVFVSRPINHFPLDEQASHVLLFGGGIGITPLLAMAHRLHALGKSFELHYSAASRKAAAFVEGIEQAPWAASVRWHFKDEGKRAELASLIPPYRDGMHVYTCGSPRYMDGVFDAATARGFPETALHREYFALPEAGARVNHAFELVLAGSGRSVTVPADRSATDMLAQIGVHVETKCSDGICGVCRTPYDAAQSAEVEHRDVVLTGAQRKDQVMLCCSRPKGENAKLVVKL